MHETAIKLLLSPPGWALLNSLPPYDEALTARLDAGLRARGVEAELVAAVLTQQQLRHEAQGKFGPFASQMLFTRPGLEQATRLEVSAHHASRYRQAGITHVADLGCGLGAESLALAGLGISVSAVDIDEATAAFATLNLRAFPEAKVLHADATDPEVLAALQASGVQAAFADPARRVGSRRLKHPEQWMPPLSTVLSWTKLWPELGVKISPGVDYTDLPAAAEAQWISIDGQVVEAALWLGRLAPNGPGRSALVLRHAATEQPDAGTQTDAGTQADAVGHHRPKKLIAHHLQDQSLDNPQAPAAKVPVTPLGRYIFEADGALIRAGLLSLVSQQCNAGLISPGIAYLTGKAPAPAAAAPFVSQFEVLHTLPLQTKKIQAYLRAQSVETVEIKKRGVDISPDMLRHQLKLPHKHSHGHHSLTLILTRVQGRHQCVIARRLEGNRG